jgi:hypothetical protein
MNVVDFEIILHFDLQSQFIIHILPLCTKISCEKTNRTFYIYVLIRANPF